MITSSSSVSRLAVRAPRECLYEDAARRRDLFRKAWAVAKAAYTTASCDPGILTAALRPELPDQSCASSSSSSSSSSRWAQHLPPASYIRNVWLEEADGGGNPPGEVVSLPGFQFPYDLSSLTSSSPPSPSLTSLTSSTRVNDHVDLGEFSLEGLDVEDIFRLDVPSTLTSTTSTSTDTSTTDTLNFDDWLADMLRVPDDVVHTHTHAHARPHDDDASVDLSQTHAHPTTTTTTTTGIRKRARVAKTHKEMVACARATYEDVLLDRYLEKLRRLRPALQRPSGPDVDSM